MLASEDSNKRGSKTFSRTEKNRSNFPVPRKTDVLCVFWIEKVSFATEHEKVATFGVPFVLWSSSSQKRTYSQKNLFNIVSEWIGPSRHGDIHQKTSFKRWKNFSLSHFSLLIFSGTETFPLLSCKAIFSIFCTGRKLEPFSRCRSFYDAIKSDSEIGMNFISAENIDEASKTVDESRGWVIGLMSRSSLHEIIKTIPEDSARRTQTRLLCWTYFYAN